MRSLATNSIRRWCQTVNLHHAHQLASAPLLSPLTWLILLSKFSSWHRDIWQGHCGFISWINWLFDFIKWLLLPMYCHILFCTIPSQVYIFWPKLSHSFDEVKHARGHALYFRKIHTTAQRKWQWNLFLIAFCFVPFSPKHQTLKNRINIMRSSLPAWRHANIQLHVHLYRFLEKFFFTSND